MVSVEIGEHAARHKITHRFFQRVARRRIKRFFAFEHGNADENLLLRLLAQIPVILQIGFEQIEIARPAMEQRRRFRVTRLDRFPFKGKIAVNRQIFFVPRQNRAVLIFQNFDLAFKRRNRIVREQRGVVSKARRRFHDLFARFVADGL